MNKRQELKTDGNFIYQGNAIDLIEDLPDNSTKNIWIDSPFCQGLNTNGKKPVHEDRSFSTPFFEQIFKECLRVLRPDGSLFFKIDRIGIPYFYPLLDRIFQNENFNGVSNLITWDKISAPGNKYSYNCEYLLFVTHKKFSKGGSTVWKIKGFSSGAKQSNGEKYHPTQTPKELIEKMLTDTTEKGDLCLDIFSGSGTFAKVAKQMKRRSIGFELNEEHIRTAAKKLNAKIHYIEV